MYRIRSAVLLSTLAAERETFVPLSMYIDPLRVLLPERVMLPPVLLFVMVNSLLLLLTFSLEKEPLNSDVRPLISIAFAEDSSTVKSWVIVAFAWSTVSVPP